MVNRTFIYFVLFCMLNFSFFSVHAYSQTCEEHGFDWAGIQYYIYSSGKSFSYTAENSMAIQSLEADSFIAGPGNYILSASVKIGGEEIASWAHSVSTSYTWKNYSESVDNFEMQAGDTITYTIKGGTMSSPGGGIGGLNISLWVANCEQLDKALGRYGCFRHGRMGIEFGC